MRRTILSGLVVACATPALADVNLEFRPESGTVSVGDTVRIGVYAVSDSGSNQLMAAGRVIVSWQTAKLRMLEPDESGAASFWISEFPDNDPFGLNELVPPQDGDGIYEVVAMPGSPVAATPQGTLLTTLRFEALSGTPGTPVGILPAAGNPQGATIVYDGTIPNLDVTGTLSGTFVVISSATTCDGDLDSDGAVGVTDFLELLAAWGSGAGGPADLDGDGVVGVGDFLAMLALWGPCP